jgi:hypothetical protein
MSTERQLVTFHVNGPTRDNIPLGDHAGYIEHLTIYLHGHPKTQLNRCMLHIERNDFPEFFSPKNSFTSFEMDVHADVLKGAITYS